MDDVKVLFIAGWARSGSTLLDNILGQVDGFFSAGEVRWIWNRGLLEHRKCACGRPIDECPFWEKLFREEFGWPGPDAIDPQQIIDWQLEMARVPHYPRLLLERRGRSRRPDLDSYKDIVARLYKSIARTSGARVVIDSSKMPPDAVILGLLEGITPYFVHLVRDPRAVTFSWKRRKAQPDTDEPDAEMMRRGTYNSTIRWTTWNIATEVVERRHPKERSMLVRYEDLMAEPRRTIQRITEMVGEGDAELPFEDDHTVILSGSHMPVGNPNRFKTGAVPLRTDDEWVRSINPWDRRLTTLVSLPLLRRYGYPVFPRDGER